MEISTILCIIASYFHSMLAWIIVDGFRNVARAHDMVGVLYARRQHHVGPTVHIHKYFYIYQIYINISIRIAIGRPINSSAGQ